MQRAHKDKLIDNQVELVNNLLITDEFIAVMKQRRVLNDSMLEEIEVEGGHMKKARKFLSLLPRRGPNAFDAFVQGLVWSDQDYIAELMDPKTANIYYQSKPVKRKESMNNFKGPVQEESGMKGSGLFTGGSSQSSLPARQNSYIPEDTLMSVDVHQIPKEQHWQVRNLIHETKDVYKMSSRTRGRAIIISNREFTGELKKLKQREGTEFDATNVCQLFDQLSYATEIWEDLTGKLMFERLMKERDREDHWSYDSFVLVILTHGALGIVYGTDGAPVKIEDIVQLFDGFSCQSLKGKPKMLFIQACQGDMKTRGLGRRGVESTDAGKEEPQYEKPLPIPEQESLSEDLKKITIGDSKGTMPSLHQLKTHEKSDMLMAYSTVQGFVSWRRTDNGSWFIRALVDTFMREAKTEHVLDMLVKVGRRVAEMNTTEDFVQQTETSFTLNKKIYFFPGYYE